MASILIAFLLNYFVLAPLGITAEFLVMVFLLTLGEMLIWYMFDSDTVMTFLFVPAAIVCALCAIILVVGGLISWSLFSSYEYHRCISPNEHIEEELVGNIPSLEDIGKVSLMDTASASKLGDRTLGGLSDVVSQYNVGDYYTICVDGAVKKVAPLEYAGFFKWTKNRKIPGYVIVDPLTNEASYVELDRGMTYSPSACFSENMKRRFRKTNKTSYFGDYSFQIDDEGVPYWVMTTMESNTGWANRTPNGAGLLNAVTGEVEWYKTEDIPEWVDLVYSGDMISKLYDRYGKYINGFWNLSDTGKTKVTEDFGYLTMGDDVYVYTGVTSVASDESNLGFILVNTRTGVFDYYPIAGAEEYSAMGAAAGVVQNFGYEASFPSLVMVGSEPTYVMVMKDAGGLVKQYACVNYKNYTIAVVKDTMKDTVSAYQKALTGTPGVTMPVAPANESTILISKVAFIVRDGQTYTVLLSSWGTFYEKEFSYEDMYLEEGTEKDLNDSGFKKVKER